MVKDYKSSFGKDALVAGLLTGIVIVAVHVVSILLKWELAGAMMLMGLAVTVAIVSGEFVFGYRRSQLAIANESGFTYGNGIGFLVVTMLWASLLSAIAVVLIHKVFAGDYYSQVFDANMARVQDKLDANPMMRGNTEAMEKRMNVGRMFATNPAMIFISTFLNTMIWGTLCALFVSIFIRRRAPQRNTDGSFVG